MGRDERARADLRSERRERGDPGEQRQAKRQHPEGADAAVLHDGELRGRVGAAAEPVRHVGEPVLVQGAGEEDRAADRGGRGEEMRQAEPERDCIQYTAGEPDERARHRKEPRGAREIAAGAADRAAREEPERGADVGEPGGGVVTTAIFRGAILRVGRGVAHGGGEGVPMRVFRLVLAERL